MTLKLFDEQLARRPNRYPWTDEFINAFWTSFWSPNEFNFKSDQHDYKINLDEEERTIVSRTLSAIGQIEIAVKTFWGNLGNNFPNPQISDLGGVMSHSEIIHNRAYIKLLDVLGLENIFEENLLVPEVKGRVEYLRKHNKKVYNDKKAQYVYSLILFTLFIENVSLFSQFYTIRWFNRNKNVLKDTAQQVDYTMREEALHAQVGIKLINTLKVEYPELFDEELEAKIKKEIIDAFKSEAKLIDWMVGSYQAEGFDSTILKEFIKHRMNESMVSIGFEKPFLVDDTIVAKTRWFDEELLGNMMVDFFNQKPVDYAKSNKSYDEDDLGFDD
jgi:ribonucleoside-diphosphate reductase beta chain